MSNFCQLVVCENKVECNFRMLTYLHISNHALMLKFQMLRQNPEDLSVADFPQILTTERHG